MKLGFSIMRGAALAACLAAGGIGLAHADDTKPPYTVKNGNEVDMSTYKGFLYYGDECLRCHGPDGLGSSYAPNLTDALKTIDKTKFETIVMSGIKQVSNSSDLVMPAFGTNPDVVDNLDSIYAYLKARSDGVLNRGHPHHLPGT